MATSESSEGYYSIQHDLLQLAWITPNQREIWRECQTDCDVRPKNSLDKVRELLNQGIQIE